MLTCSDVASLILIVILIIVRWSNWPIGIVASAIHLLDLTLGLLTVCYFFTVSVLLVFMNYDQARIQEGSQRFTFHLNRSAIHTFFKIFTTSKFRFWLCELVKTQVNALYPPLFITALTLSFIHFSLIINKIGYPSKHVVLSQCCFNVGPTSKTAGQH